jgi:hypothetical protein
MIYDLLVGNVLDLSQSVAVSPTYINVSQSLILSQLVQKNIRTRGPQSSLALGQTLGVQKVLNLAVGNFLDFQQQVRNRPPIYLSVQSPLILWHSVKRPYVLDITHPLTLTQNLDVEASTGTRQTLGLSHSVQVQVIRNFNISHALTFRSRTNISSVGPNFILPVRTDVVPSTLVTFTYGAFSFQTRTPDWNNKNTLEFSRINRKSRGGDLIIYRDPQWPESITLDMTFSALTEQQKDQFRTLFRISLGRPILFVDHLGDTWAGIILNPGTEISQTGRNQWQVEFQLQGSRT